MSISPRLARHCLGPVLLAFLAAAGGARADDGFLTWIVQTISYDEDPKYIPASAMQVPQEGTALATGQQISTAAGQHMVLANGRDLVEIKANSTVVIGDDDAATSAANLNLITGTVHVEVGKRAPGKTFSVGAPYLVATVKGTRFDVNTSSAGSSVSVTEGVVAVSSLRGGDGVDVTAGNTASVKRGATGKPSLVPTQPRSVPAGSLPASTGSAIDTQSAGTKSRDNSGRGSDSRGSDSGGSKSGGSGSGGSGSGGSDSGGSSSGGSSSGSSGSSGSGSGGSSSGGSTSGSGSSSGGGGLGGAVSGTTDKVGDAVSGATGALGGAIGGSLGDTVSGVGDAVGDTVSGVGGAVGGLVGGLGGALDGSGSGSGTGGTRERK